jgi:activator of HSP90 ATPase
MNKTALKTYHGQADIDIFAKTKEQDPAIITASMKEIKEAYKEFMQDLLLESQEAY